MHPWPSPAALLPLPLADGEPESRNVPVSPLRWYLSPCLAGGRLAGTCKKYLGTSLFNVLGTAKTRTRLLLLALAQATRKSKAAAFC